MSYRPQKKVKNKKPVSYHKLFRAGWSQKRPILFFSLVFVVLMVLFYAFWFSHFCQTILQPRFFSVNATLSSFILNLFGMGTVANRECISSSVFSVNIARGCDAVEAMALFASAMLAYPSKWNDKLIGFLASILVLFVLNISRVVSLFLTGIYFPKAFEFMHVEFWQVLFVIFAIGLLFIWIKWTEKEASHDSR